MAVLMGLTLLGGRAIEPRRPEFMLGPNGASRLGEGVTTLLAARPSPQPTVPRSSASRL